MNKKLIKTRNTRTNTLQAMACKCGTCTPTNCSGGGSFQESDRVGRLHDKVLGYKTVR